MRSIYCFFNVVIFLCGMFNSTALLAYDDVNLILDSGNNQIAGKVHDGTRIVSGRITIYSPHDGFNLRINGATTQDIQGTYVVSGQLRPENTLRVRIESNGLPVQRQPAGDTLIHSARNSETFYIVADGEQMVHSDIYMLDLQGGGSVGGTATINSDKQVSVRVRFVSDIELSHELHPVADAFRVSDLAHVSGNQAIMDKAILVAQGKITVSVGELGPTDQIVVRFTAGCGGSTALGSIAVCNINGGLDNSSQIPVQLQTQEGRDVPVVYPDGWGVIQNDKGRAYYRVSIFPSHYANVINQMVGDYQIGVEAATYIN